MAHVDAYIFENPLPGIAPRRARVRIGSPVRDIVADARVPMVCIIDGIPLQRDYWMQRSVCAGDVIEFHPVFLGGGRNGSGGILGTIAMMALSYFAPYMAVGMLGNVAGTVGNLSAIGRIVAAGIVLIGSALISAILPRPNARANGMDGDRASSVYSVDTQGNQAKIFSPIPVQYGKLKAFPDYAAPPYTRYDTSTSADGDQYYYALFCLGQGEYDIHAITIADAPISSFKDVIVSRILPPGHLPQSVNALVVSSDAVTGNSLDDGNYVGGFPCCGPGRIAKSISVDFVFPQGLCHLDSGGKAQWNEITIVCDIAPMNENGDTGEWRNAFQQTIGASSLTPQRRTIDFAVPPGRYMVRVRRNGSRDASDNYNMTACQWASLRAELVGDAPLCKTATHYELVIRASEQLSQLSQRKIGILCTRKVRDFEGNLVASRSPILALLDKWQNSDYGDALPLDRIDIPTLRKYDALSRERQDLFDYRFENRVTSEEADQLIAKVHRCAVLQRYGVKTIVRDELVDLPVTMFTPTNTTEGSVSLDFVQITEETGDGVIVEYFSNKTDSWEEEECPAPGRTYTYPTHPGYDNRLPPMDNPVRVQLSGISEKNHAIREGMYYAATNALRRQFISWQTEMQGILVHYGAAVLFASTLYNSSGSGEIIDYREEDGAVKLSGDITEGQKIVFMDAAGGVSEPFSVQILPDGWILPPQSFGFPFGGYDSERPRYALLSGNMARRLVKLTGLEPRGMGNSGAPEYQLRGVVDVPEVHTCDIPWLPKGFVPPEIPAPALQFLQQLVTTDSATWRGSGYPASLIFYPDGRTGHKFYSRADGIVEDDTAAANWINNAPVLNIGADYEIALAFRVPAGFEKFIWLDAAPPANNMIMQGHRCAVYTNATIRAADDATQSIYAAAMRGSNDSSPVFVTYWRSMAQQLEFSGGYNEMDVGATFAGLRELSGVWGIRGKTSRIFQGYARFVLLNNGAV